MKSGLETLSLNILNIPDIVDIFKSLNLISILAIGAYLSQVSSATLMPPCGYCSIRRAAWHSDGWQAAAAAARLLNGERSAAATDELATRAVDVRCI